MLSDLRTPLVLFVLECSGELTQGSRSFLIWKAECRLLNECAMERISIDTSTLLFNTQPPTFYKQIHVSKEISRPNQQHYSYGRKIHLLDTKIIHQSMPVTLPSVSDSIDECIEVGLAERWILSHASTVIRTQGGLSQMSAWPNCVDMISTVLQQSLHSTGNTHDGKSTALSLLSNSRADGREGRDVRGERRSYGSVRRLASVF